MRARNLQTLTDAVKRRHPSVVIYGKGDEAHALRTSDHNEDDTAGSKAAQSDADSNPEHRAIDIMLGESFTRAQAYALIADLLADPLARSRLRYIIFDGWEWHRNTGWAKTEFTGEDKHRDHIHASGQAVADENTAAWATVDGGDMSALAEQQVSSTFTGMFRGGSSCGAPVAPEYQDTKDGSTAGNSLFEQLAELRGELKKVREQPPGSVDPAVLAEVVRQVVREEIDRTVLAGR